eukprot:COSAG05_NODE_683_length_7951_cov_18.263500_6_plen_213_part_00
MKGWKGGRRPGRKSRLTAPGRSRAERAARATPAAAAVAAPASKRSPPASSPPSEPQLRKRKAKEAAEQKLAADVAQGGYVSAAERRSEGEIRVRIKDTFKQMFCPPRCDWKGKGRDGTISRLMAETGSKYETIEDVLLRVQAGLGAGQPQRASQGRVAHLSGRHVAPRVRGSHAGAGGDVGRALGAAGECGVKNRARVCFILELLALNGKKQ